MSARKRSGARRPRESAPTPSSQRAASPRATPAPRVTQAPALLLAALALGFALRALATFDPSHRAWGLDTLSAWPLARAIAVIVLGAIGFVPPVARVIERGLDALGAAWERLGSGLDLMLAVGAGAALYGLRDPIKFTGDFSTRVSQLVLMAPTEKVFPQALPLDRWINIELPRYLMRSMNAEVMNALHTVGAVVGFCFVLVALRFARAIGAARGMLPAAAALILGGGYMLHFAGYDKFGPLLVGVALAATGAVRLAREGRGAWMLGLGMAVAVLAHRSGYALAPAALVVLAQAWRRAPDARSRLHIGAAAAVTLGVTLGFLPRAWHLLNSVDRLQNLPGAPQGGGPLLHGLADVVHRAGDGLNLLFLITPLWLAGLAAAVIVARTPAAREAPRFSLVPGVLLALAAELLLLVTVRGAQGVARDWDMHVAPGLLVALLTAYVLVEAWRRAGAGQALAATFTTALASSLALWGIHLNEPIAIARVGELLQNRRAWSDAAWARAHDYLGVRALQMQRPDLALPEFLAAISVAPNPRFFFEVGIAYRMMRDAKSSQAYFEKAHALDRTISDPWVGFALNAVDEGKYAYAIACCESALAISPHRGDAKQIREGAQRALQDLSRGGSPFR